MGIAGEILRAVPCTHSPTEPFSRSGLWIIQAHLRSSPSLLGVHQAKLYAAAQHIYTCGDKTWAPTTRDVESLAGAIWRVSQGRYVLHDIWELRRVTTNTTTDGSNKGVIKKQDWWKRGSPDFGDFAAALADDAADELVRNGHLMRLLVAAASPVVLGAETRQRPQIGCETKQYMNISLYIKNEIKCINIEVNI